VSFFAELRRRNVFKVGAAYAVVAWLLLQITDVVLPTFGTPQWVAQTITFVLAIGFPITVVLAWAFDLTPQGIRSASDSVGDIPVPAGGQRFSYVVQSLLLLAVGFLVFDQFILQSRLSSSQPTALTGNQSNRPVRRYQLDVVPGLPIQNTGVSHHLAVSPDGSRLVYAVGEVSGTELYLHELDQFEARLMPGTAGAQHPFFSPDGEWVAFYSDTTDAKLKRASVRGGPPQILTDIGYSSGGSWVTDDAIIYGTGSVGSGRNLYSIAPTGGTPDLLVEPEPGSGHSRPEVLPGGNAVLLVIRPGEGGGGPASNGGIAVLSLETGELRNLIRGGYAPHYAPTGHIVFAREGALWAVPFDTEQLQTVGKEVPVVEGVQQGGLQGAAGYAFSRDGLLVYVPGRDSASQEYGGRSLVWVDRDGREEILATPNRAYLDVRLASDGQRAAVTVASSGDDEQDIWVADLERGSLERLTTERINDSHPLWTPDGTSIVYQSARAGTGPGLFVRPASGAGQAQRLTTTQTYQNPESFSPDGTELIFREGGDTATNDLHVLSLGDELVSNPVLQTRFNEGHSTLSPNGLWIAYESDDTGRDEIYVRPYPNIEDERIQISIDGGREPLWGPDGRELFFLNQTDDGAVQAFAATLVVEPTISVDELKPLFAGNYRIASIYTNWDISSNDQRFLMIKNSSQQTEVTRMIVVENWFEELERLAPRE
jgi:Tol biopolymer transport system component